MGVFKHYHREGVEELGAKGLRVADITVALGADSMGVSDTSAGNVSRDQVLTISEHLTQSQ